MTNQPHHATHPEIVKRLKRAKGHLAAVVEMIEAGRACVDIAQQLYAVEKAISQAKRTLIQDHIDHCLDAAITNGDAADRPKLDEFKAIAKFL